MIKIGFSIVLCTYNGGDRLIPTLTHIAALDIPIGHSVELIIVDNASTDDTTEISKKVWEDLGSPFDLLVLTESRSGKGYAAETGYDAAKCSYILTVDDDNWLNSDYLVQAISIFDQDQNIGVLQGYSIGEFEVSPPAWIDSYKNYFIIGSPILKNGYFPENSFYVWGAGMVIKNSDWKFLRNIGFFFMTSKKPGKAAGEDNELALALLIMGKKIYYSDKLKYIHFMPAARINWNKLKDNFEIFGYVSHYFFLYALVIKSYKDKEKITKLSLWGKAFRSAPTLSRFTWKQHAYYWVKPLMEWYQLELTRVYSRYKWSLKLLSKAENEISLIESWLIPLLDSCPNNFEWPSDIFNSK